MFFSFLVGMVAIVFPCEFGGGYSAILCGPKTFRKSQKFDGGFMKRPNLQRALVLYQPGPIASDGSIIIYGACSSVDRAFVS